MKGDKEKRNFAAAVFNFYGANEGANTNAGTDEEDDKTCEVQIDCSGEAEGAVELPSYAPEVCVETGRGVEIETQVLMAECSENEVSRGQPDPESAEETIAVETKPHPPTNEECMDVTEEDIFGNSDEDMEACGQCVWQ